MMKKYVLLLVMVLILSACDGAADEEASPTNTLEASRTSTIAPTGTVTPTPTEPPATEVPTATGTNTITPTVQPSGDRIVYSSKDGFYDWLYQPVDNIYIYDITLDKHTAITHDNVQKENILVSPDGNWVAFYQYVPYQTESIKLININTLEEHEITGVNLPTYIWSSDSKYIYAVTISNEKQDFVTRQYYVGANFPLMREHNFVLNDLKANPQNDSYLVNLGMGPYTYLCITDNNFLQMDCDFIEPEIFVGDVFWSNDGKFILYIALGDLGSDIFQLDPETKEITQLTDDDYFYHEFQKSPDKKWFIYFQSSGDLKELIIRPDFQEDYTILLDDQYIWDIRWSPDSEYIVFSTNKLNGSAICYMKYTGENFNCIDDYEGTDKHHSNPFWISG